MIEKTKAEPPRISDRYYARRAINRTIAPVLLQRLGDAEVTKLAEQERALDQIRHDANVRTQQIQMSIDNMLLVHLA